MDYRMKRIYLETEGLDDNKENERFFVEKHTKNIFHRWNKKLEILTRICDYYSYLWRFYPDGQLVMQMILADTKDSDTELRGISESGHLEYSSIDEMLIDWLEELKRNEGSYDFSEEINYIESMTRQ